jgi:TonB-linked SusC/RagA family outer membrane protein
MSKCLANSATALTGCALLLYSPGALAAARDFTNESSETVPTYVSLTGRFAQDVPVAGRVTQPNGEALPGVTVVVKGTTTGTSTGADGAFSLNVPAGSTLVFTSVGFAKQEVVVSAATSSLVVKMADDTQTLSDVVVVGYGEQKKETLTGAVATIDQKIFKDRGVVDNPLSALQGQVPGVVVTRTSAAPGRAAWNFNIRGQASTNSTQPLIVIDGITINDNNALNSINPNDIENISFLKDAAAAIYGARAAGGVVLITTKKAAAGKMTIQYDGSVSRKVLGLQPHLINVQQFGQGLVDATTNDFYGVAPTSFVWYKFGQLQLNQPSGSYLDLTNGNTINPANNPLNPGFGDVKDLTFFDNNAVDVLWGSATSTQHNVALSGRTDKAGYRVSLGFLNDGSQLQWGKNSNRRYNIRATNDFQFSDRVKLETNFSLERQTITQPTNTGYLGQYAQPGFPTSTIDGKPYAWGTQYAPNWQAELGGENEDRSTRVFTNLRLTTEVVKNLRWVNQVGYNWALNDIDELSKSITWYNYLGDLAYPDNPTRANSYYQREQRKDAFASLNSYLNYARLLGEKHDVSLTVGGAYERDEFSFFRTRTSNLASNEVPALGLGIGDASTRSNTEGKNHYAIASAFGRANYAYNQKYLLEVNARYDGSSKFRAEDRWQFFSGVSGGWRISEEGFLKDRFGFLNELKLRASYGVTGNQSGIGLYDYLQLLNVSYAANGNLNSTIPLLGSSSAVIIGPTNSLVSLDRTWERVENTNAGLDFAVLNRRLSVSADYFIKHNRNMLIPQQYPAVLGAAAPQRNQGHRKVWGWEAQLNWQDNIGDFGYRIGGSITDNQNKLLDYGGPGVINAGFNGAVQGYPLGSYFGLAYDGRIQTEEQRAAMQALTAGGGVTPVPTRNTNGTGGVRIGDNAFKDLDGDGKLSGMLTDGSLGDLKFLGTDNPRYTYAINLGATWKGFDFGAIIQGVGKRTIFREGNWRVPFGSIFQGQTDFWVNDTWTPTNTGATYPILSSGQNGTTYNTYNYQISDWSVQNGAYARLKNVVLGYTIPQSITKRFGADRVRIYYSGNDLWEITRIKDGWDPEATRSVGRANSESTFTRYPFFRLHTAGVNFTF